MSELAAHETDYGIVEGEPPELLGRNLNSAGHLLASATAFFFLAFLFAYFYLRSLNNAGLWQPKHVTPSITLGTLVMALSVLSAVLVRLGLTDQRAGRRPEWRLKAGAALAVGVGAVVLQAVEWVTVGFGPADGGYASVFFGWTAFNVLFVLGTFFWLQNLLATAIRYRNVPVGGRPAAGHASGDPGRLGHDVADPLTLVRPGLEALSFYWTFLAGLGVLAWIVLYLI
jgi:heme/copper-type cytochrome/quinol oxidase subunit 3